MNGKKRIKRVKWRKMAAILAFLFGAVLGNCGLTEQAQPGAGKLNIFDDKRKTIVVNGYSTSFHWPRLLQEKLDRMYGGKRVLTVRPATKGIGVKLSVSFYAP